MNHVTGEPDTILFDYYNTALQLDQAKNYHYYNKSKLVPGAENMPYVRYIPFADKWALDLGGISGTLGTQKERTVFFNQDSIGAAPVICYESIFGEYVTDYVKNGANLIFIITNDGWWKDTPGYKQHCAYAALRSIETRRSIARSANTGTSCFIDQRGDILQATAWRTDAVINATIRANTAETFYVRYGDFLARGAIGLTLILLAMSIFNHRIKKIKIQ
jgi:apolipoprotein N-acyltransferase